MFGDPAAYQAVRTILVGSGMFITDDQYVIGEKSKHYFIAPEWLHPEPKAVAVSTSASSVSSARRKPAEQDRALGSPPLHLEKWLGGLAVDKGKVRRLLAGWTATGRNQPGGGRDDQRRRRSSPSLCPYGQGAHGGNPAQGGDSPGT